MAKVSAAHRPEAAVPPEPVLRQLRIPMVRKATLELRGKSEEVYVIDVGIRGLFVEREEVLPVNESVSVRFTLPGNELPIETKARVAWAHAPGMSLVKKNRPAGLGLEFVEIGEAEARRVHEYVVDYCKRHPKSRQFNPSWPDDVPLPGYK